MAYKNPLWSTGHTLKNTHNSMKLNTKMQEFMVNKTVNLIYQQYQIVEQNSSAASKIQLPQRAVFFIKRITKQCQTIY